VAKMRCRNESDDSLQQQAVDITNGYLGSTSSTFYVQLLRKQIPNAQKRQSSQQCHLALLGPTRVKAARKM